MGVEFAVGLLLLSVSIVRSLDNGLARTPPMGWLSWERFRCVTDCVTYPDSCISEKLFMDMADRMAADGFLEAGYQYIIIDDCWLAKDRDASGQLQPDPNRFPHGIPALSKYIHDKGLKFGIYEDFGTHTCGGYPGSEYYLQQDAQTFANWGVDYFKMDGCYSDPDQFADGYPAMGFWLNKTGRPILYSCSWPAYQEGHMVPDYKKIAHFCNIWRNYDDIDDSWESIKTIMKFYGDNPTHFAEVAAPGSFNDPDMLIIGNFGLSHEQERTQMAIWSVMASPLIMSVDLRNIRAEAKALLLNKYAIAINQDALGIQGRRIKTIGDIQIWTKPIQPDGNLAFVFVNTANATPQMFSIQISDLGLSNSAGYNITEVFNNSAVGIFKPTSTFAVSINPNGVFFGRAAKL
jgi:hypothetical protein